MTTEVSRDPNLVEASPTKAFFIHMITRDVPLSRAILDLIDNCVDGAIRLRGSQSYDGLWVRLELTQEMFRIADNCGGIPVEIAREYAFRFGRPNEADETSGSIGQFGVGMKRSLFKLGKRFTIQSEAGNSRFSMDVDVDAWIRPVAQGDANHWHFEFASVDENPMENAEVGTIIEITRLRDSTGDSFVQDSFLSQLSKEISAAHSICLARGIAISLNGVPVGHTPHNLFSSEALKPAYLYKEYSREILDGQVGSPVKVRIYAGIEERSLHDGGWYIFCNGRLVVRADQTALTVWGPTHNLRLYHPDVAYFRGYVFFDADHAALLPWTTTKTGVDADAKIYRLVQQEMIEMTRPVLDFLNQLERERRDREAGEIADEPLRCAVDSSIQVATESITTTTRFVAPAPPPRPPGPRWQRIQYSKPYDQVMKVKELLGATTYTSIGEMTFDYYYQNERND